MVQWDATAYSRFVSYTSPLLGRMTRPNFCRLRLRKEDGSDHFVRLIVGHPHDDAGTRITEVTLERQSRGEGGAAEHRHQVLRDADGGFGAHHLRLNVW